MEADTIDELIELIRINGLNPSGYVAHQYANGNKVRLIARPACDWREETPLG